MMEYKFNIGDQVWYLADSDEHETCECCGQNTNIVHKALDVIGPGEITCVKIHREIKIPGGLKCWFTYEVTTRIGEFQEEELYRTKREAWAMRCEKLGIITPLIFYKV
jgi:hypothetical protein